MSTPVGGTSVSGRTASEAFCRVANVQEIKGGQCKQKNITYVRNMFPVSYAFSMSTPVGGTSVITRTAIEAFCRVANIQEIKGGNVSKNQNMRSQHVPCELRSTYASMHFE